MNKPLEVGVLVTIAALTTLSVSTVIHDANAGKSGFIDQRVEQAWNDITAWVRSRLTDSATPVAGKTHTVTISRASAPMAQNSLLFSNANETSSIENKVMSSSVSGADVQTLTKIGKELTSSMSSADWASLIQDLTSEPTDKAQTDIEKILAVHLSPSDLNWLSTHFQGAQAFNQQDVELLQNAVHEITTEMTPAEQTMVKSELAKAGITLPANLQTQ